MCIGVGYLKEPPDKGLGCEEGVFVGVWGECLSRVSLKKSSLFHSGVAGDLGIIEDRILRGLTL